MQEVDKTLASLDKKLAIMQNDLTYVRKEIEGNGRKGLIQRVDEIEANTVVSAKAIDERFDGFASFQNKAIGAVIVANVIIVPIAVAVAISIFNKYLHI